MSHAITLFLILVVLFLYSNLFTSGYFLFLEKRKAYWSLGYKIFIAFALSFSTIILIFLLPKYLGANYSFSIWGLVLALGLNFLYSYKNRKFLVIPAKVDYRLFALWFLFIAILLIPAVHFPWYFGWGIDWVNHAGLLRDNVIDGGYTFYTNFGAHAFLSIFDILGFSLPAVFQVGSAYFLSLNIFPIYFLAKDLIGSFARYLAIVLWLIVPFHYLFYGEYIPSGASIFLYLTLFVVILNVLKNILNSDKKDNAMLLFLGGFFLATAIYMHSVFLYGYFYIYALLSLLYFVSFKKIWPVIKAYFAIIFIALILLSPFLTKFISGTSYVLFELETNRMEYSFSDFVYSIQYHLGSIVFFAGFLGVFLFLKNIGKKGQESFFNKIVIISMFLGTLMAVNIYAGGNTIWNVRSYYLLSILLVFPLSYLFIYLLKKWRFFLFKAFLVMLLIVLMATKIAYLAKIEPMWSANIQSSLDLLKKDSVLALKGDENLYVVLNTRIGLDSVFFKVFSLTNGDTYKFQKVILIDKAEYENMVSNIDLTTVVDNDHYQILRFGNDVYFYYKVDIGKSFGTLDNQRSANAKPERTDTLDFLLKRRFFVSGIEHQVERSLGTGLAMVNERLMGQSFISNIKGTNAICLELAKSREGADPIFIELYKQKRSVGEELVFIEKSYLSTEEIKNIALDIYQQFCFGLEKDLDQGAQYLFYVKTEAKERYYGVLNAGNNVYENGSAYDWGVPIEDDLVFSLAFSRLFSWM